MLELKKPISDNHLTQAICLRCSGCFPAMNIANALGGSPSTEWEIVRTFPLVELIKEAIDRKIDLASLKTAVMGEPLTETKPYQQALAVINK